MAVTLNPIVSSQPGNPSIGSTYSWIGVENNQNRPLYAQATYLTNANDIQLSVGSLTIDKVGVYGVATLGVSAANALPVRITSTAPLSGAVGITHTVAVSTASNFPVRIASTEPLSGNFGITHTVAVSAANAVPVNVSQSNLLSASLGVLGFNFVEGGAGLQSGSWSTMQVISAAKFSAIGVTSNSTVGNLANYELPQGFTLNGLITSFNVTYGAVLAYKI